MRQKRENLICALAQCIDTMVIFSIIDVIGTIETALSQDDRVWDYLADETIATLAEFGFERNEVSS